MPVDLSSKVAVLSGVRYDKASRLEGRGVQVKILERFTASSKECGEGKSDERGTSETPF